MKTAEKEKSEKVKGTERQPRQKKLSLQEVNATLYESGKTSMLSPVTQTGTKWSTSSKVISNNNVVEFTKHLGVLTATTNDENHIVLSNSEELSKFIDEL